MTNFSSLSNLAKDNIFLKHMFVSKGFFFDQYILNVGSLFIHIIIKTWTKAFISSGKVGLHLWLGISAKMWAADLNNIF